MRILVTVATVIVVVLALAASAMSSDASPRSTVTAREDVDEFGGTWLVVRPKGRLVR
jgi:hypothetical protein